MLLNEYRKVLTKINKERAIDSFKKKLFKINSMLWNIENKIRKHEADNKFDAEFIELARSVYYYNDKRSSIKNEINVLTGSHINEVKEYSKY